MNMLQKRDIITRDNACYHQSMPDEEETDSTTGTTTAGLEDDPVVPTFQCSTLSQEEYRASVSSLYTGFIITLHYITHVSRLVISCMLVGDCMCAFSHSLQCTIINNY